MPIKIHAKGVVLSERESWVVDKLIPEYYAKIERQVKNEVDLVVHIKVHDVSKRRQKFNIHVDVANSVRFGATADDWELARAIHKVMKNIMSEIEHKLHASDQHDK